MAMKDKKASRMKAACGSPQPPSKCCSSSWKMVSTFPMRHTSPSLTPPSLAWVTKSLPRRASVTEECTDWCLLESDAQTFLAFQEHFSEDGQLLASLLPPPPPQSASPACLLWPTIAPHPAPPPPSSLTQPFWQQKLFPYKHNSL
ncbi:hypothetical protein MHU86_25145 [Fragilaria crotonensis]|nr:hypothetical protein MHU86_25145 [Fragilaria crotonensis]